MILEKIIEIIMSKRAEEAAWAWSVKNKLDPYSMGRAFGEGYEQAEKELALTWEDVKSLDKLTSIVEDENFQDERRGRELRYDGDEKFYSEVLRRFNEQREKK